MDSKEKKQFIRSLKPGDEIILVFQETDMTSFQIALSEIEEPEYILTVQDSKLSLVNIYEALVESWMDGFDKSKLELPIIMRVYIEPDEKEFQYSIGAEPVQLTVRKVLPGGPTVKELLCDVLDRFENVSIKRKGE